MRHYGYVTTRQKADQHCQDIGGNLVSIKSKEVQNLIVNKLFPDFFDVVAKVRESCDKR